MAKLYAYVLTETNEKGIVTTWNECKLKTNGVPSRYMSFNNETEAKSWLESGGLYVEKPKVKEELKPGIYFDSGKRGKGFTRVRVSNEDGKDLLPEICKDYTSSIGEGIIALSWFGYTNHHCECTESMVVKKYNDKYVGEIGNVKTTNNFGELVAFILSCIYVLEKVKNNENYPNKIFGDSNLILSYWSKGAFNGKGLSKDTKGMIMEAVKLREKLEALGVEFLHVSGDFNPADLGDHK